MLDISFTGGFITIDAPACGSTTIDEFSDEGSPIEVDEIEVTGYGINMNGIIIRWRKPSAFVVKVTVIPMSSNDTTLAKLLTAAHVEPTGSGVRAISVSDLNTSLEICAPQINASGQGGRARRWSFSEGCIVSGSPAVATDAEGKMQSKTYTFVFERLSMPSGEGMNLTAGTATLG